MLKGISPLVSPELLSTLFRMGHGDEIVLADAHFPAESLNSRILRADGLSIPALLNAILPLFEIDAYVDAPLLMMSPVEGDTLDPTVESGYRKVIAQHVTREPKINKLERFDFYKRAEDAFAILVTGETAKYGNLILKKGVTPLHEAQVVS